MVARGCTREKAERKEQEMKKAYHTRCGNANYVQLNIIYIMCCQLLCKVKTIS
jgi:hypothetical protein